MTERIAERFEHLKSGDEVALGCKAAEGRTMPLNGVVLPGSFNPLHEGHLRMAAIGHQLLGRPVAFEISIENVDKPPLVVEQLEARIAQFECDQHVWVTRGCTFLEKSRVFPGATFLVGADTISRIVNPRYYANGEADVAACVQRLVASGSRFLVFGRVMNGGFKTWSSLNLPWELRRIGEGIAERDFRIDVSSREIRRA